jgi:hypothetical protein
MLRVVKGSGRRHVERFTCGLVNSRHFGCQALLLLFLTQWTAFWRPVARLHYLVLLLLFSSFFLSLN